jgi:hypothetical protein
MRGPAPRLTRFGYRTLALTNALAVMVNVHVFRLLPPLEHAPDQIASRPLDTDSVNGVPAVNGAGPLLPTATLMPAGADRSPVGTGGGGCRLKSASPSPRMTVSLPVPWSPTRDVGVCRRRRSRQPTRLAAPASALPRLGQGNSFGWIGTIRLRSEVFDTNKLLASHLARA